jgi:predicted nucleic acid-binding protein
MLVVDSSVWVDYFNGHSTPESDFLHGCLGVEPVGAGDVILVEVLQGFRDDADYATARKLFAALTVYDMLGATRAVRVADNYRSLRQHGVTVRKTLDAIIATFCIDQDLPLLFSDKDFRPFVRHLGLRSAMA